MRFRRSFHVDAPAGRVVEFHRAAASLAAITPPLGPVRVEAPGGTLDSGDEVVLHMWVGPVPVRWVARIEEVAADGFLDRQVEGPFASWVHRHRFFAEGASRTRVEDEVVGQLKRHLLWGPVGLAIWLGLPALFAFRAWRTRRLLAA